jgi:hypothetical protein
MGTSIPRCDSTGHQHGQGNARTRIGHRHQPIPVGTVQGKRSLTFESCVSTRSFSAVSSAVSSARTPTRHSSTSWCSARSTMPPGPLVGLCRSGHQQTGMDRGSSTLGPPCSGSGSGELAGTAEADCAARDGVAFGSGCGFDTRAICKREFVIADGCAVRRSDLLPPSCSKLAVRRQGSEWRRMILRLPP